MKGLGREFFAKLQLGVFPHVADLQGANEVRKVVSRIIHHGLKHGTGDGIRIAKVGGQVFADIFPLPAKVIHGQVQIRMDTEGRFGVRFQQFAKQRVQTVIQPVGQCFHVSGPAFRVAGKA